MSSSPFEIFRRNLKPLMVFLTLLALFSFVVLPALDTYMRRGGGMNANPVAATFDGTELTRTRVARTTQNHRAVVRFLFDLASLTLKRGGVPQTPGFQLDEQSGQITAIGIDANPSEEATIHTLRFYHEALKAGFELDDVQLKDWLTRFSDGTVSDNEIMALLSQSSGRQLGQQHLYEQLRMHLLADLFQRGALVGLSNGQIPIVTPLGQWENFLKLNQQATVTAYGVLASEYFDQTDKNPSQSDIQDTYAAGRERISFPGIDSPVPSFRRPDSAEIEYVAADLEQFIESEKAKLTEQQLREEYERRHAGGDFQVPADMIESDGPATTDNTPTTGQDGASDGAEASDSAAASDGAGANEEAAMSDEAAPSEAAPSETAPSEAAEANEKPASSDASTPASETEPAPEEESASEPEPAPEEESAPEPEPTPEADADQPDAEASSQNGRHNRAVQLVAFQDEEAATEADDASDAGPEPENSPAEPPAENDTPADAEAPAATEAPAESEASSETQAPAEPQAPADMEASTESEAPAEAESADPESMTPAAAEEASPPAESATEPTTSLEFDDEPAPTKTLSFEDVRDQLASEMAIVPARRALDDAVTEANKRMRNYFSQLAVHESNVSVGVQTEADAPPRLNLQEMADELGLQYGKTQELVNRLSVEEIAPGSSFGLGTGMNRRGPPYSAMMFGAPMQDGTELQPQPVFSPLRSVDLQAGVTYISWKTKDVASYIPKLDEARDEVVRFLRMAEARELAKAAAEEIATAAGSGDKTLADVIPAEKKDNLIENVGPFSWLEQVGFMQTVPAEVPELDAVGDEFMRAVFTTEVGEYAVGANDPQSVYYVVTPIEFQPDMEQLHEQFRQPQQRLMAQLLGSQETRNLIRGYLESVDARTGFKMNQPESE